MGSPHALSMGSSSTARSSTKSSKKNHTETKAGGESSQQVGKGGKSNSIRHKATAQTVKMMGIGKEEQKDVGKQLSTVLGKHSRTHTIAEGSVDNSRLSMQYPNRGQGLFVRDKKKMKRKKLRKG